MNGEGYKEVYFHEYCKTCVNGDCSNVDEPCNECLDNPLNLYTHKPVKYEYDPKRKVEPKPEVDPLIGVELLEENFYKNNWVKGKMLAALIYQEYREFVLTPGKYKLECSENLAGDSNISSIYSSWQFLISKSIEKTNDAYLFSSGTMKADEAPKSYMFSVKEGEKIYMIVNVHIVKKNIFVNAVKNISLKKIG